MEREEGLEGEVHARKMFSKKVIARDAAAPFLEIGINFYTVYGSTVSREGGEWGEQWLYGRVLGRIAVAHRCRIRRGGRRNRTISHSERRVTGPFSRVVSRLLRTSTLYNHVYPRQNFPLGRSVRIRRTGARSAGKRRQTVDKLYEIAWLNAALRFGCDPSVGLQSNYIEFDSRVIQRRSTCPV